MFDESVHVVIGFPSNTLVGILQNSGRRRLMFIDIKLGIPPILTFVEQGLATRIVEMRGQLLPANIAFAHVTWSQFRLLIHIF